MNNERILALRCALLIAIYEAEKFKNTDDGGTSNFDTPFVILKGWSNKNIKKAFELTGLIPDTNKEITYILGACEGQGFRRTAMAEAFRDSLKEDGYNAGVYYQID